MKVWSPSALADAAETPFAFSSGEGSSQGDAMLINAPPRPPRSPERTRSGLGVDPAEWLGGRPISYPTLPIEPLSDRRDSSITPPLPSPGLGVSSSDEHHSGSTPPTRASGSDLDHLVASPNPVSMNTSYPNGSGSRSGSHSGSNPSMVALGLGSGSGSSGHGHGSSPGHGTTGSSHGHNAAPQDTYSLLPTQSGIPPTSYRLADDSSDNEKPKNKRGILGRPLKWVRGGRPAGLVSESSLPVPPTSPVMSRKRAGSASSQVLLSSPRQSSYGSPKPWNTNSAAPDLPPLPIITRQPASTASLTTFFRQGAPTLGSLPASPFLNQERIPEHSVLSTLPAWSGPAPLPSPALTEHSSTNLPDGLLDARLGDLGMRSTAAISLRDDIDYSRPIGGVRRTRYIRRGIDANYS